MSNKAIPGKYYRHFKGNLYAVLSIALHSETKEEMVIYHRVTYEGPLQIWARPMSSWVSPAKNTAGEKVERFKLEENSDSMGEANV